jgi:HlyD family secretion protein
MNRTVKRISTVFLVVALGILAIYAFRPKPIVVDIACAARGPLQITIDEDGQTRAHDRFTLTAPIAGLLSRIALHEGDAVTADTVIAVIQPLPVDSREEAEIRARIAAAQALRREAEQQVVRAETAHEQARRDLGRAELLFRQEIMPRERFEEIQSKEATLARDVEAAKEHATAAVAEVQRAEAGLISIASERRDKMKAAAIRAPVDGRILRILEKSEGVVASGTPIVILSNTNKIELVADLLSIQAVRVQPGAAVFVENWGGDEPLRARIRTVEPFGFTKVSALGIEEQRVNVVADFVDPPTNLGDGYRVDVRVVIWENADVLKVPTSALFRTGEAWSVFVVDTGLAQARSVQVGHRNALEAEVLGGLQEGEEVVLYPSNDIKDGTAVRSRTPER